MLLMSRHLSDYHIVPAGAVIRINLAWEPSLDKLKAHLDEMTHHVFLDVPSGRTKPPSNRYSLSEIVQICERYENVKYLGISQVETDEQLMPWIVKTPERVNVVPKIESTAGVWNINTICKVLRGVKTIMLDHDDLFLDLCNQQSSGVRPERMYPDWIDPLLKACRDMNVRVLRTAGVVFLDT